MFFRSCFSVFSYHGSLLARLGEDGSIRHYHQRSRSVLRKIFALATADRDLRTSMRRLTEARLPGLSPRDRKALGEYVEPRLRGHAVVVGDINMKSPPQPNAVFTKLARTICRNHAQLHTPSTYTYFQGSIRTTPDHLLASERSARSANDLYHGFLVGHTGVSIVTGRESVMTAFGIK